MLFALYVPYFKFYKVGMVMVNWPKHVVKIEIKYIQHFNYQLTHTTLKNVDILKHSKISKTAPTCFGLERNHHQGATASA
jgi:hypothetical protein